MLVKNLWTIVISFIIGLVFGSFVLWFLNSRNVLRTPIISPLGIGPEILATKIPSKKPIIGFLPYWNLDNTQIPYHLLDYIAYFSVGLKNDGSIQKANDQGIDIGWYKLQSQSLKGIFETSKKREVKRLIVISCFDNAAIDSIISNKNAKSQAINNIIKIVKEYGFDGVNIDFEYNSAFPSGDPESKQLAAFLKDLDISLKKDNPQSIVSVDLYANAFIKNQPYVVNELAPVVDHLVLMGYDFHQPSSPRAGPVAPIRSSDDKSIAQALEGSIQKKIPSEKIILAMPFYGYEWQTTSSEHKSPTYPESGAMASYKRVSQLIKDKNIEVKWDTVALSPWFSYTDNGITKQVYFENDTSIGLKLQLVDQVNLGGAAIWALGYEGKDATVWQVIEDWRRKER